MFRPETIEFSDFTYLMNRDISPLILSWLNQHSTQQNQMRTAGIDIGSRTIECVVLENRTIVFHCQTATTFNPLAQIEAILARVSYDQIMATGYGRNLFELHYAAQTVTEIKAYGRGARQLFPTATTIVDIGGQDSKCIALGSNGKVQKFEMNDRCAAGTGKFLEVMAEALQYPLDQFGSEALLAEKALTINAMCTVFAESEVTSLIARGEQRRDIALGLHQAVVRRTEGMIRRLSTSGDIVFAGGVARNSCIRQLLSTQLNRPILVPEDPQMLGALGAALLLADHV